jgi:hypothetical protein
MRRVIITEFSNLSEKLSNQCVIFSFQLQNLCIKAEPASLLTTQVNIDGQNMNLEECAAIGKGDDDYTFKIVPLFEEDLTQVALAIKKTHPEFKQDIEEMQIDDVDMASVMISEDLGDAKKVRNLPYILLTMPVVNDNRYDVLTEGVKLCYDECKVKMDAIYNASKLKLDKEKLLETKDDQEKLDGLVEKLKTKMEAQREQIYNHKLQEIEAAHSKWAEDHLFDSEG